MPKAVASCGSTGGYFAHRRRAEPTCALCRTAFAAYVRARRGATKKPCAGGCGALVRTGKCRACHHKRYAKAERRRVEACRKLESAALGSTGRRGWVEGPCNECGVRFAGILPAGGKRMFCSRRCLNHAKRRARRGREAGADGTYTWAEVMRLFLLFDRHCAYCQQPVVGQPDPDHVVPLSRGGSNSLTNILPCCRLCNSDKRELLLPEWAEDRALRGKPPVTTAWPVDDPRYQHITSVMPMVGSAAA